MTRLIRTQFGLIARWQCLVNGWSPNAVRHRVRSGEWVTLAAGVYADAAFPSTYEQRLMTAVLAGGGRPVVSHRSAGVVLGWDTTTWSRVEVWVPRGHRISLSDVVQHEIPEVPRGDIRYVGGLPVTAPFRTLLDLAAVVEDDQLEWALESALRNGELSIDYIGRRLDLMRVPRSGRRGAGRLRRLVARRGDVPATESWLETRCLQVIRAAGLPEPVRQLEVFADGRLVGRADYAYPDQMVFIEAHGLAHHNHPRAIVHDWRRQNELVALGWRPFIFSADDAGRPELAMDRLARLLGHPAVMAPAGQPAGAGSPVRRESGLPLAPQTAVTPAPRSAPERV